MIEEISNTYSVTMLKEVKLSKKVLNEFNKLESFQKEDGVGQLLADKCKYVGDKAALKWIKELSELKRNEK